MVELTDDRDVEVGFCEVVELVGAGVVVGGVEGDEKEVDVDVGFGMLLVVVGTVVGGIDVVEGGSELLDGVLGGENELEVVGFVEDEDVAVDFFVAE
jgi:hypothetical protein